MIAAGHPFDFFILLKTFRTDLLMRLIDVNNVSLASTDFALHRRSSILGFRAT